MGTSFLIYCIFEFILTVLCSIDLVRNNSILWAKSKWYMKIYTRNTSVISTATIKTCIESINIKNLKSFCKLLLNICFTTHIQGITSTGFSKGKQLYLKSNTKNR